MIDKRTERKVGEILAKPVIGMSGAQVIGMRGDDFIRYLYFLRRHLSEEEFRATCVAVTSLYARS